ncbi:hypothetical protein F66182_8314 [Fusarium sp. NRRL 66182]|nr:hypothetical protein F66182_8314 [Fusarium sp. NRRL 66182]
MEATATSSSAALESWHQPWHQFIPSTQSWKCVETSNSSRQAPELGRNLDPSFTIATWNMDAGAVSSPARTEAIISYLLGLQSVDIIFFQEVSKSALVHLLQDSRIRQSWYSSEQDLGNWGGHLFATMTFLSKDRFTDSSLGPLWRVKFPSRFGRDALCCDISISIPLSMSDNSPKTSQLRLVNVHLDSLALRPSKRPAQLSIVADILRRCGQGLVAGDFNAVLPEDDSLVQDNGLVDAWTELLHPEPGFTWGVDGKQKFPPGRLDKVAMLGLQAVDIQVLHPHTIQGNDGRLIPWSDHCGLKCTF